SARARRKTPKGHAAAARAAIGTVISTMIAWLSGLWRGGAIASELASLRDAPKLAQLHGASFHRGWGEAEFEQMLAERNTLVHRLRMGRESVRFSVVRMVGGGGRDY